MAERKQAGPAGPLQERQQLRQTRHRAVPAEHLPLVLPGVLEHPDPARGVRAVPAVHDLGRSRDHGRLGLADQQGAAKTHLAAV
ncbi:hypothetical protein D3C76_1360220 [compost metagenome]